MAVLDHLRSAVLLTARAVPPVLRGEHLVLPGVSLLAIVQHLTDLEHGWFACTFAGSDEGPRWSDGSELARWPPASADQTRTILMGYRIECGRSRAIAANAPPGATSARPGPSGEAVSLEWVLVHMIAETGRHAGHADVLRHLIDGTTEPPACGAPRWR